MSGEVSAADREKAIHAVFEARVHDTTMMPTEHIAIDTLIGAGWRPGGARPSREALARAMFETESEHPFGPYWDSPDHGVDWKRLYYVRADALLAADHLWTAPAECTCFITPEGTWTTHYGAVDPASQLEPNYDCPMHFPNAAIEREAAAKAIEFWVSSWPPAPAGSFLHDIAADGRRRVAEYREGKRS